MDIKEKLLSYWAAFIALLKKGYFALEDRYYAALDWLNQYIPVYKVIDPIDRHFPSFILFIIIMIGLVAGILMMFLFPPSLQSYNATLVVIDADSKDTLPGLDVFFSYLDKNASAKTGKFGEIKLENLMGTVSVNVKVGRTKIYGELEKTIVVSDSGPYYLALMGGGATFKIVKTIVVKDRTTNLPIQNKKMSIEFSCSLAGISKWTKSAGTPEYEEAVPINCGTMRAGVSVPGYEFQEKDLVGEKTNFLLNPTGDRDDEKGTIVVYVKSAEDESPLPEMGIYLYGADGTQKNVGISDESGSYVFEVNPGKYHASAMDSTGAYAPAESAIKQVNSNDVVQINLIMIPVADANRIKLLARLVDSGTNEAVSDAEFKLFVDNAEIKSYTSDANGFVVVRGIEEGHEFSAVITHPDYVTQIAESIDPIKETENNATVIQLERAYRPACGNGIIELGESCDSGELNDMTCQTFGFPSGNLKCSSTCQLDTSECVAQPSCGNGIIDLGETCDTKGPNFDNKTCSSFDDFSGGTLSCSSSCQVSTANCTHTPVVYGDGVIGPGEVCDSDNLDGKTCSTFGLSGDGLSCVAPGYFDTSGCTGPAGICNDSVINPGESCDGTNLANLTCLSIDSFTSGTLGCTSGCNLDSTNCGYENGFCGDGAVGTGETCDILGPNLDGKACNDFDDFLEDEGALQCRSSCTIDTSGCVAPPTCGNGLIDPGESCDGSNLANLTCGDIDSFDPGTLSCTDTCTIDTSSCPCTVPGECPNVGSAIISVSDESAEPVEGAEAHLYKTTSPGLDLGRKFTGSDGKTAEYENLGAGEYFATASNNTGSGTSPEKDLILNQTIELPVALTLGESAIEVYVSDSEGTAIGGAQVNFYEESDGRQIGSTTTDASGKAEKSLRVDLNPYIVVSATGYLQYTTTSIALVKDNIAKIYVTLYENVDVENELDIEIAGVYDALVNGREVNQLASGRGYYFRFNVIVPNNAAYGDVIAHLRTDLDSILNASSADMKFWIKAISVSGASAIKSATFDPNDPYSNQNEVETDAKQANISFGDLDAGVYELYAQAYIKSGLPDGTLIELHYSAKSDEFSTNSFTEQYHIGDPFCTGCTFAYAFSLDGSSIDPNATTELLQDIDYELGYEIYNAGDVDYNNVTAGFSDSANALILDPTSSSLGSIDSKATVSDSLSMEARAEVALTQLLLQLSPNAKDNNATANFKVLAKNPMVISASPQYLYPRIRNILKLAVSDGSGHAIEGALLKLSLDSDFTGILASGDTAADGTKRFNIDALEPDTIIYISAEKPNYIAEYAEVEVKDAYYPPAGADFSCLEIEDVDGTDIGNDGLPDVNILKGWHSTFKINSLECSEDSSITLSSELSLSSDASSCSNPSTSLSVDLQTTDSKTLCVLANKYQGEYPVYVNAQFASSTESSRIAELTVYAYDTSSCFWIDKTAFDVFNNVDSGTISNKCYSYVEDSNYPYLISDTEAVAFPLTTEPINEEILMLENFKGLELTKDANSVDFNISVTGKASVELKQADIYMQSGAIQEIPGAIQKTQILFCPESGHSTEWGDQDYLVKDELVENNNLYCLIWDNEDSTSPTLLHVMEPGFAYIFDPQYGGEPEYTFDNYPIVGQLCEAIAATSTMPQSGTAEWDTETGIITSLTSPDDVSGTQQGCLDALHYSENADAYEETRGRDEVTVAGKHALSVQTSQNIWNSITAQYYPDYYPTVDANGWVENYGTAGRNQTLFCPTNSEYNISPGEGAYYVESEIIEGDNLYCTVWSAPDHGHMKILHVTAEGEGKFFDVEHVSQETNFTAYNTVDELCDVINYADTRDEFGTMSWDSEGQITGMTFGSDEEVTTVERCKEGIDYGSASAFGDALSEAAWQALSQICGVQPTETSSQQTISGETTCKSTQKTTVAGPVSPLAWAIAGGYSCGMANVFGNDGQCSEGYTYEGYAGEITSDEQYICVRTCAKTYTTSCDASCNSGDEQVSSTCATTTATESTKLSPEEIAQAQEACDAYAGLGADAKADKMRIEVDVPDANSNPKLDLAKWTYIRTKPNAPEITFDVENVSLDGTQYAVITVRDYTTDAPQPEMQDIALNWAVSGMVNETSEQQVPVTETGAFTIQNPEVGRVYEVGTYALEAAPEVSDWKWLLRIEGDEAFVVDATDTFIVNPDGAWVHLSSSGNWPYGIVTGLPAENAPVSNSGTFTFENPYPLPSQTAEIAVEALGLPGSLPNCIGTSGDNCGGNINIRSFGSYQIMNYTDEEFNIHFFDSGDDGRAVFFAGIKYKSYLPAEYSVSDDSDLVEVFIDPSSKKVYAKVLGTPAPTTLREEKFHVKLQSGYANLCYGRDDVPGNFGSEKVPKVKFDWDWSNIAIDACDPSSINAVYCDATQFSVSLMKRIEMIDNLMNVDNNYNGAEQYKHFSAYLMKDGYSEDFQEDFANYYANTFFGAGSWFAEGGTAFANIFKDPVRFVFTDFNSTGANPRENVKPLASPGLYNADIGLVYDNADVNDFFSAGANPNVTVSVYLTLVEVPENDNPFYYLPFNGSIGMEEGVYARAGYGLGYEGAELLISQNDDTGSIKTATSSSNNTIATEKYTDFDTVNITYSGSVLMATPDSVSLLPSDATPVLMRVKEHSGYADAFYSLRDGDARFGTNADYMASWTGIASSNDCRDFAGNALYSNRRDYLANNITHHATMEPSDIGDSAFGFSWESADTDADIYLRSILYAPIGNTIDLFPAYSDNPLFVSPVEQITETTKPIRLNYTSAVLNSGEPIISSIEDVFDLANEDKLCIASSAGNIDFYWNPEFISEALKPYSDEVNEILCRD
ncbi:MAG: carboxypeptidase regulatory-like domain-containing protein [Candidatus Diapherotrites archaeon]|nr:carboxypeptidase regulatory-like domain-containing protein [Candidatus Diapherotrites archaeon]